MELPEITPELSVLLKEVDTPTVCNAVETAQGKRGFDQFTRSPVTPADPNLPAFFGIARTARICGSRPPSGPPETAKEQRLAYYRYMAEPTLPRIAVIEDIDEEPIGAFWGEVNTTVHKGLGVSGVLTNGLVRDLGDVAPGFQVLAGGVGPSHYFVHVVEIDMPVNVLGLKVNPGDFIHADRHGAAVVPPEILPELADAIRQMQEGEQLVIGPAKEPGFDIAALEKAWEAFENARS